MGPLDRVRVLEVTNSQAGQIAGMLLSDMGADVVRHVNQLEFERTPEPARLCWNRGKKLVDDESDVDRLVRRANIIIVDSPIAELSRLGLDADAIFARNERASQVWLPPADPSSEWSEIQADQLLVDGLTTISCFTPGTSDAPSPTVFPGSSVIQGAMGAVAGLAGLVASQRDGHGRSATVNGFHAGAAATFTVGAIALSDGDPIGSTGVLPGPPQGRLYQTSDQKWLYLAAVSFEFFKRTLEVLGRSDLLTHAAMEGGFSNLMRQDVSLVIGAEMQSAFRRESCDHWLSLLAEKGVPATEVLPPDGWLTSDVLSYACPPIGRTEPTLGTVSMPGPVIRFEDSQIGVGEFPDGVGPPSRSLWTEEAGELATTQKTVDRYSLPLSGLKVIDLSTFMAGPFASALLAQAGADVFKVEPATGDPYSPYAVPYGVVNQHKRRAKLDLRDEANRAEFLELVSVADVMFDNLTEASLDRLNLGSDVIAKANPLLVRGTIRAFGTSGPYVNNPGFDQVIQAMSGLMVRQGGSGRPISTSYPIHDVTGGCLLALGSLAELYVRYTQRQSGRAWVTLASTAALIQSADMTTYAGRPARQTGGLDWRGPSSWHRYYQTADRWIGIAAETSEQREALLVVLQKGDLLQAEDAAREAVLVKEFEKSPASVWLKLLKEAKVPAAPVARQREFDMPHLAHARFAEDFQTEGAGMVKVPVSFVSWNGQLRREALSVENRHCDVKEVAADWTADRVLA